MPVIRLTVREKHRDTEFFKSLCMLRSRLTLFAFIAFTVVSFSRAAEIVSGTHIEARLLAPSGSRISHSGDPMEAAIIAPVVVNGRVLVPQGAMLSGVVERVERVGLGLKHPTSGIAYRFDTLRLPDGMAIPVDARVARVETAKERVNAEGLIGGIYPTANLSSTIDFYAVPALCMNPAFGVPLFGVKCLIARSPDPEIYFPAGTELILELTTAATLPGASAVQNHIAPLSTAELAEAERVLATLPEQRTDKVPHRASDLVNVVLLGGRDSIARAFEAAGWSGAQHASLTSIYRMYHCMVQRIGYSMAPMGNLTLNGAVADAEYQKSLDTFSKRHHVRLWKQGQQDVWLGAATEDVGYRFRRMHLTHASDPLIDNERAKVVNDLAFTGCVAAATLIPRDSSFGVDQQGSIKTDGKIAIIRISDCASPPTVPAHSPQFGPRARRRSVQMLIALRNDVIRANPVSLTYNTIRGLREHESSPLDGSVSSFRANPRNAVSPENKVQFKWIRPSVLDAGSSP